MATFLNDPFTAPSSNVTEIVFKIRTQLFYTHGKSGYPTGPVGVAAVFANADAANSGSLDRPRFEAALTQLGVFLPLFEVNALMRHFPAEGNSTQLMINYSALLAALQLPTNDRRQKLIAKAYAKLDPTGTGYFKVADVISKMNASKHPELSADQVQADFAAFFESKYEGNVTRDSFFAYYQALGEVEPVDAIFVRILEGLWGVQEEQKDPLHRLGVDLIEKILERCTDNETETEMLHKTFSFFRSDRTPKGKFTQAELLQVLEHYGLIGFDKAILQQLWEELEAYSSPADREAGLVDEAAFEAYMVPIGNAALALGGRDPAEHSPDELYLCKP